MHQNKDVCRIIEKHRVSLKTGVKKKDFGTVKMQIPSSKFLSRKLNVP